MQHVHYDLDKVEKDIRTLYATAPSDNINDNPAVVDVFRRSVDVEVSFCRFTLGEIMGGTPPDIMLDALVCVFANLIINRMQSYQPDQFGNHPATEVAMRIAEAVIVNFEVREEPTAHSATVEPVVSGRA